MRRTLLPTPDEPRPNIRTLLTGPHVLEPRGPRDFLPGHHAPTASPCPPPDRREAPGPVRAVSEPPTIGHPLRTDQRDGSLAEGDNLTYIPAVACCYAIVQYDAASARLVGRITGLFGDVECAETYARDNGYRLYDVVPATAVIPTPP
jgi:hypothetical protein